MNTFQSSSQSPISFFANNNLLTELSTDPFNLASGSITIDVSFNRITYVNESFSKWIQAASSFILNLSNNLLPCDATIQWMANFVICPPVKIIFAQTDVCPNGEPIYDYLIPYAKCGTDENRGRNDEHAEMMSKGESVLN